MPDLSASLDVTLDRTPNAIVIPRDSLKQDGNKTFVRVRRGDSYEDRSVTIAALNAHEAMVSSGLEDGVVLARNVGAPSRRE